MVAQHCQSRYVVEGGNPAWLKIRNSKYSQLIGRDELFARRCEEKGAPEIGWDVCDRACSSLPALKYPARERAQAERAQA